MSDRDERGMDPADRMSRRFGPDESDETDEQSEPSKPSEPTESDETDEQSELSETSQPSKTDETDQPGESDEQSEPSDSDKESVKAERVGTYMYLPQSQNKRLARKYNVLKAEYEFEYDDELEKNRHFYALVAEYGLDSLDDLSASDVRERLESHGWL